MMRRFWRGSLVMLPVLAVGLSACGPEPKQVAEQSYEVLATAPQSEIMSGQVANDPVLDEVQIRRIVAGVQDVLDEAQELNDPEILKERLVGPALEVRTAEFERAAKTGTELEPLEIQINVASATVAEDFPRTLLVGSAASADNPAKVFLFSQEDAQSDYMLDSWVRVVGGESIRGVEIEAGSRSLRPDSPGFIMTPGEAGEAYARYLQDPGGEEAEVFVDEVFAPAQSNEISSLRDAVTEVGEIGFSAEAGEYPATGVTLADGQGLVSTDLNVSVTYKRTVADSTMAVGGTAASYLESPDVIGSVTANYLVTVFFLLPPEGSEDPIRIVGAERVITSVERDDSVRPEGEN